MHPLMVISLFSIIHLPIPNIGDLLADLWLAGGGDKPAIRVWTLPQHCSEFQFRFDSIQEQLEELCGMDDLLTGLLSKSKGQILRLAAVFNALYSLDPSHSLSTELSSSSVKAAINFVQVCNEHTAIMGGQKNITTALSCKLTVLNTTISIFVNNLQTQMCLLLPINYSCVFFEFYILSSAWL